MVGTVNLVCASSEDSDKPAHPHCLVFARRSVGSQDPDDSSLMTVLMVG